MVNAPAEAGAMLLTAVRPVNEKNEGSRSQTRTFSGARVDHLFARRAATISATFACACSFVM